MCSHKSREKQEAAWIVAELWSTKWEKIFRTFSLHTFSTGRLLGWESWLVTHSSPPALTSLSCMPLIMIALKIDCPELEYAWRDKKVRENMFSGTLFAPLFSSRFVRSAFTSSSFRSVTLKPDKRWAVHSWRQLQSIWILKTLNSWPKTLVTPKKKFSTGTKHSKKTARMANWPKTSSSKSIGCSSTKGIRNNFAATSFEHSTRVSRDDCTCTLSMMLQSSAEYQSCLYTCRRKRVDQLQGVPACDGNHYG